MVTDWRLSTGSHRLPFFGLQLRLQLGDPNGLAPDMLDNGRRRALQAADEDELIPLDGHQTKRLRPGAQFLWGLAGPPDHVTDVANGCPDQRGEASDGELPVCQMPAEQDGEGRGHAVD